LAFIAAFTVINFLSVIISQADVKWHNVLQALLVAAAFSAIATYAGKQASKKDEVEREAKRMQLELAAFDPFVSDIDEPEKGLLKAEIVKRMFGQKTGENNAFATHTESESMLTLTKSDLEGLLGLLRNIIG